MRRDSQAYRIIADVAIALMGIVVGWLYLVVEPVISALIFYDGNLAQQILELHPYEIWMRSLFVGMLILFSIFAQLIFSRHRRAERKVQELYRQEKELRKEVETEIKRRAEFTRALVHELKTPLTPVLSSSEMLTMGLQEEPWLSLANNIYRGACNLNERIDELLDIARGELGMLRVELEPLEPRQLLQDVANDMTTMATSCKQSLILDLPTSLPLIRADEKRIRQVLLNLLGNAFKFTPEGGKITLRAWEQEGTLMVEIHDNGPGIAEEDQERLFEAYYQAKHNKHHGKGLGLGLALCKKLVELHGGRIWVESHIGQGSTFRFTVPIEAANQYAMSYEIGGEL